MKFALAFTELLFARDVIGQCEMVAPPPMYDVLGLREHGDLARFINFA